MSGFHVAIVGATGAVGQTLLEVLKRREFPVSRLTLMASVSSAGGRLSFAGEEIILQRPSREAFRGVEIAFFSAGSSCSREFVPWAQAAGAVVIDNSSAFRLDPQVPLVVPEINSHVVSSHSGIIANPNCCTLALVVPLAPLHRAFGIRRVVVCTYQAASGAGSRAMDELHKSSAAYLEEREFSPSIFPYNPAFNLFPHNSDMQSSGYCEEEEKIIQETQKIMEDDAIAITATCVRVPVMRAHSEAVNMEFSRAVSVKQAREVLRGSAGVLLFEEPENNRWATPLDASGRDEVLVGRLREDQSQTDTLDMWIVADQLLKGAALNAVQIAELL